MFCQGFEKPKKGHVLKAFHYLIAVALIVGCAKKKSSSPPPPCATGVNGVACEANVVQHTTWSTQLKTFEQNQQTKQAIPGSERNITVSYEFFPQTPRPLWRRSMIIESVDGNVGMFEQGEVEHIDGDSISLAVKETTCDDASVHLMTSDFKLYYLRSGGLLQLDTQPIQAQKVKSVGDIFGNIMAEAVGSTLRTMLESTFTFGSARTFLTSGHGNFNVDPVPSSEKIAAKSVTLGCFSTFGSGFSKSAVTTNW
jgi:hypothetical protein